MKFDQTSRDLLAAARYTERHAPPKTNKVPTLHLLDCVSMSLGVGRLHNNTERSMRYEACAARLFDAIGSDLADFTKDKAIDALVAAAFWNVPPEVIDCKAGEPDGSPDTIPPRSKRDPTNDDHYDGNDEQIDDLKDLVASLRSVLRRVRKAWDSVPEDVQVPDEINDNALWAAVDKAIA